MRFKQTAPGFMMAAVLVARAAVAVGGDSAERIPSITGSPIAAPTYTITSNVDGFASSFALLDDLSGDSVEEMAVGSPRVNGWSGEVLLYNGATGTLIRTIPAPLGVFGGFSTQLLKWRDMTGDGISDLLVSAYKNGSAVLYVLDPVTGDLPQTVDFGLALPPGQQPTWFHELADINGDSVEDLVVWSCDADYSYRLYFFSGVDFTLIAPGIVPPPEGPPHFWVHPSAIQVPDISGDSVPDLLISYPGDSVDGVDLAGRLYLYDTASGNIIREITETPPRQDGYLLARAVAGDITGDGYPEVVLGGWMCTDPSGPLLVNLIDGSFPARLPREPHSSCGYAWSVNLAPDFDGDSVEDLVVNIHPQDLNVLSGADLSVLSRIYSTSASQYEYTQGLVGPDLDNDGVGEIVALSFTFSTLSSYTLGGQISVFRRYQEIWHQSAGDFGYVQRTGAVNAERAVSVSSSGTLPLDITGTEIVGVNASDFRITRTGASRIAGGSSGTVCWIDFDPATVGEKEAALRFHSNDPLKPVSSIKLTAIAYDRLVGSGTGVLFAQVGGYQLAKGTSVLAVDLATGDRSIISSPTVGSGPIETPPGGIILESPESLVVAMGSGLYRVDLASGNRTALSTPTLGVGPTISIPTGLARDGDGNYILVGDSSILKVDPQTGDRTVIGNNSGVGTGARLDSVYSPLVLPDGNIAAAVDTGILCLNPVSGDRILITLTGNRSGRDLDPLPDGSFHLLPDSWVSRDCTFRVDIYTGSASVLSSTNGYCGFIGNGEPWGALNAAAVAPSSGQLYVYDGGDGAIYRIDQSNGNRWMVSSDSYRGTGPQLRGGNAHGDPLLVYLAIDETASSAGHWNRYE